MKTFTYKLQGNGVDSWIVTDTNGEKSMSYISPIEMYKKEVNDFHNTLLENVLKQHNYISIGEVALWLQTDYNDEAHSIINWWKLSSEQVIAHLETITEYKDSLDFGLSIGQINYLKNSLPSKGITNANIHLVSGATSGKTSRSAWWLMISASRSPTCTTWTTSPIH
jgi:hypothetical protein